MVQTSIIEAEQRTLTELPLFLEIINEKDLSPNFKESSSNPYSLLEFGVFLLYVISEIRFYF